MSFDNLSILFFNLCLLIVRIWSTAISANEGETSKKKFICLVACREPIGRTIGISVLDIIWPATSRSILSSQPKGSAESNLSIGILDPFSQK